MIIELLGYAFLGILIGYPLGTVLWIIYCEVRDGI